MPPRRPSAAKGEPFCLLELTQTYMLGLVRKVTPGHCSCNQGRAETLREVLKPLAKTLVSRAFHQCFPRGLERSPWLSRVILAMNKQRRRLKSRAVRSALTLRRFSVGGTPPSPLSTTASYTHFHVSLDLRAIEGFRTPPRTEGNCSRTSVPALCCCIFRRPGPVTALIPTVF